MPCSSRHFGQARGANANLHGAALLLATDGLGPRHDPVFGDGHTIVTAGGFGGYVASPQVALQEIERPFERRTVAAAAAGFDDDDVTVVKSIAFRLMEYIGR